MGEGKVFKVLAIDGGGIKGLYSSTILEHLEEKYNCNLSDYFDLICGTSTGGLIALALSLNIPAKDISAMYINKGSTIFPRRGIWRQLFWKGKYSDEPLKKVLYEIFGDRKISESKNLLCIPTYSITDARPWVFKYDHKEGQLKRDNKAKYVDVALATSAAPTYFPVTEITYFDSKQFIDGGVWAVMDWRQNLLETFFIGQNSFTNYIMEKLNMITNVDIKYVRIPSETISAKQEHLVQMDLASTNALNLLRGKGNDRGLLVAKDDNVADFFINKKHYNTEQYGKQQ